MEQKRKVGCAIVLLAAMLVFLGAILGYWVHQRREKGQTEGADIALGATEVHTQADLEQAAAVVLEEFEKYRGCALSRLWYDEARLAPMEREQAEARGRDAGDVLLLLADFQSGETGVWVRDNYEVWLEGNTRYGDFCFFLVRGEDGWQVDFGRALTEPEPTPDTVTPTPVP